MSKNESPEGTWPLPNSPRLRHNKRSQSPPKCIDEKDDSLTEDDDNDSIETDQIVASTLLNQIDDSGLPSLKSRTKYQSSKTAGRIHIPSLPDSEQEKKAKSIESKKPLVNQARKTASGKTKTSTATKYFIKSFVLFCILGLGWLGYSLITQRSTVIPTQDDRFKLFLNDLKAIKNQFPHQNDRSWLEIHGGVSNVMNTSAKPWTFVLFSNETTTTSCLAELLGAAISKALQSNSSLVLRPKDMGNEYGDAIDRLRPLIIEKKAVVVHDLLNIHPGAIQAFHSMCDRENPLVKGAVYIITIITHGYATSPQKPEVFVENLLTTRFINKVDVDKLQPLITRLTDGPIIPVEPGNVPAGCTI
ncbi:torsin-1A-interacting protein 2 [Venturia canescens]|uniref:torsin-1A-interacting protein 2 n=1 Tax=Venturia canescens TaxID=32260 RepID=UPI001C9C25BD|nr:torsin-1A-interacting protein 2 [Venturia canescens]XP_043271447.1 torsin-1A-interacting protein 2 [Venturia canescens]